MHDFDRVILLAPFPLEDGFSRGLGGSSHRRSDSLRYSPQSNLKDFQRRLPRIDLIAGHFLAFNIEARGGSGWPEVVKTSPFAHALR
jgi:hypothetical protein